MKDAPAVPTHQHHEWYSFHFGSQQVASADFNPAGLFGACHPDCYVLFADFCSFSTFFKATENLAIVEPLMTSFYSQVRKAIHRHDGMLDQILGDGVLAVWGLHKSAGDAASRLVAVAAELVQITSQIATQWQSHIDLLVEPKGLRIGLSKGSIIVIRRDQTYPGLAILGNPINLASRLQTAARANQMVCSNQVYQDLERAGLTANFRPYKSQNDDAFVDAKNIGPVKAWVADIQ